MSEKERIIIKDSCILFDLIDLKLMDAFFSLGLEVYTTEFVIAEVTDSNQLEVANAFIDANLLKVDNLGTYEAIQEIYEQCRGLSFPDCSILEFAMRSDGVVLSSDNTLRKEILKRKFKVRGLLWVIRELKEHNILSKEEAIENLLEYKQINDWAPEAEIAKLINTLKDE